MNDLPNSDVRAMLRRLYKSLADDLLLKGEQADVYRLHGHIRDDSEEATQVPGDAMDILRDHLETKQDKDLLDSYDLKLVKGLYNLFFTAKGLKSIAPYDPPPVGPDAW